MIICEYCGNKYEKHWLICPTCLLPFETTPLDINMFFFKEFHKKLTSQGILGEISRVSRFVYNGAIGEDSVDSIRKSNYHVEGSFENGRESCYLSLISQVEETLVIVGEYVNRIFAPQYLLLESTSDSAMTVYFRPFDIDYMSDFHLLRWMDNSRSFNRMEILYFQEGQKTEKRLDKDSFFIDKHLSEL